MHTVFVYGSLKRGFFNHALLRGSEFLGEGVTELSDYTMQDLGFYPGVFHGGKTRIHGELYSVDDTTLMIMHRLEGHPNFYRATPTRIETDDGIVDALMYVLDSNMRWGQGIIESGNWNYVYKN